MSVGGYGLGIANFLNVSTLAPPIPPFSDPSELFAQGESGAWYDPSDLSTMYQQNGSVVAAVVGQPVGMILDKSQGLGLGGNIANPGPYTLFRDDVTITDTTAIANVTAGKSYRVTTVVSENLSTSSSGISFRVNAAWGNMSSQGMSAAVGTKNNIVTALVTGVLTIGADAPAVGTETNVTISSVTVEELPGVQAYQPTAASRPILRQDGNGKYYLEFDGVDDCLVTRPIDLTNTNKVTAWTGATKQSDDVGSFGMLLETGANSQTVNGAISFFPSYGAPGWGFSSRGTVFAQADANSGYPAPDTAVLTGIGDIAAPKVTVRVNGVQAAETLTDQGTGNYGNLPFNIGRRDSVAFPMRLNLYGLVVRGAASSPSEITGMETWMNGKTGAY